MSQFAQPVTSESRHSNLVPKEGLKFQDIVSVFFRVCGEHCLFGTHKKVWNFECIVLKVDTKQWPRWILGAAAVSESEPQVPLSFDRATVTSP